MRATRVGPMGFGLALLLVSGGRTGAADVGPPIVATSGPMGYAPAASLDTLSPQRRRQIEDMLQANLALLRAEGKLREPAGSPVLFRPPLAAVDGLNIAEPWGLYYFVDQDPAYPDSVLDHECGNRTYDNAEGYNHGGSDFTTWPWPWRSMSENKIVAVAGADGILIGKEDGNPDQCGGTSPAWNAVYVQQADGTIAWYGHLKQGTVTSKGIGEPVALGEVLGIVGSSGTSGAPHVHFELHGPSFELIDPYAGPCNSLNPDSRWVDQEPYYDSKVLRMTTGAAAPSNPQCGIETPNELKDFTAPDIIYFTLYFRDLVPGQMIAHQVFNPDGSLNRSWNATFQGPEPFPVAWSWWSQSFPAGSPSGTYRWRASTAGGDYDYLFNIGVAPAGSVPSESGEGVPLRVAKLAGGGEGVELTWGDSCRSSDSDYEVYEGVIDGTFRNYARKVCSTGGASAWSLATTSGDLYWLVVPRNALREGSYGTDSDGNERPQPASFLRCLARSFGCDVP